MEGCEGALEKFKASLYYVYFKDFPDDLIAAALVEASCLPSAAFILSNCPKQYCKWLVSTAQTLLKDLVKSVDVDGNISISDEDNKPQLYLKKRKVLDIECEWAEIKSCLTCKEKLNLPAKDIYEKCRKACLLLGVGITGKCETECYTCEGGKILRR